MTADAPCVDTWETDDACETYGTPGFFSVGLLPARKRKILYQALPMARNAKYLIKESGRYHQAGN